MPRNRTKVRETYAGARPLKYGPDGRLAYQTGKLASRKVQARVPGNQPALYSKARKAATQERLADIAINGPKGTA